MTLIDISPVIDADIAVWPGDTPYVRTVNTDMAAGENLTLSDIRSTVHVGAHADAPSHYVAAGEDIASRSLDYYVGPCVVLHVDGVRGRHIRRWRAMTWPTSKGSCSIMWTRGATS